MYSKTDAKLVLGRQGNTSANNYVVHVTLTEKSTNVTNNTSTLAYKIWMDSPNGTNVVDYTGVTKYITGWAFDNISIVGYININGNSFASKTNPHVSLAYPGYSSGFPLTYTLLEGESVIQHNSDGKLPISVVAGITVNATYSAYPVSGSMTFSGDLTTIARGSTLSVPATEYMGTEYNLTIAKSVSTFTHTIQYKFGSKAETIVEKTSQVSVKFTPPVTLGSQIPTSVNGKIVYTVITYNGSTEVGRNTAEATLNIPASNRNPVGSISLVLDNSGNAVVSSWGIPVKGYSKYRYSVSATASYGASISKYSVSFASQTFSEASRTTNVLTVYGDQVPSVVVTDSRGLSATITGAKIFIYNYSSPVIVNSQCYRTDEEGTATDDGEYLKMNISAVCSCDTYNRLSYKWQYADAEGSSGIVTINDLPLIVGGFDSTKQYTITLYAYDSLNNYAKVVYPINSAFIPFHISDNQKCVSFFGYDDTDGQVTVFGNLRVTGRIINE